MPHYPKPFFRKSRGLWYVQIAGKQVNLGPDQEAAFRRYHELLANPVTASPPQQPATAVAAICDNFLEWVQRHRSAETYEWYRYRLQRFIEKYPDLTATELRPYHVEQWVDDYQLSQTSRRNYFRSIKRCLKWAVKQGYIDASPIEHLEVPAGERKDVYVSPDEFQRLLGMIRDESFRDLLVVTYETGCRPQESLRVEARHVDLANSRWVFPQKESKTKDAPRIVYLSQAAAEITRRLMLAHPEGPLFRNSNGRPWTTEAVNCAFGRVQHRMGAGTMKALEESISDEQINRLVPKLNKTRKSKGREVKKSDSELRAEAKRKLRKKRAAELAPRCSLYALRHSWATNALQRGVDSLTVAILMGHKDPSMLAKVYQHLSHNPQHMLEQARKAVG